LPPPPPKSRSALRDGIKMSARQANAGFSGKPRLSINSNVLAAEHETAVHLAPWNAYRLRYFTLFEAQRGAESPSPLAGQALVARGCKGCASQGTVNGMDWFSSYVITPVGEDAEIKEVVHDYSLAHNLVIRPDPGSGKFYGLGGQDGGTPGFEKPAAPHPPCCAPDTGTNGPLSYLLAPSEARGGRETFLTMRGRTRQLGPSLTSGGVSNLQAAKCGAITQRGRATATTTSCARGRACCGPTAGRN
jgi:hypothetical protein